MVHLPSAGCASSFPTRIHHLAHSHQMEINAEKHPLSSHQQASIMLPNDDQQHADNHLDGAPLRLYTALAEIPNIIAASFGAQAQAHVSGDAQEEGKDDKDGQVQSEESDPLSHSHTRMRFTFLRIPSPSQRSTPPFPAGTMPRSTS